MSRLEKRGIFGALIPLKGERAYGSNRFPRMRHLHPDEAALYNALDPRYLQSDKPRCLRLDLAGVGQSLWVFANVKSQLIVPGVFPSTDPKECMGDLFCQLFDARDSMMGNPIQTPRSESFLRSLMEQFPAIDKYVKHVAAQTTCTSEHFDGIAPAETHIKDEDSFTHTISRGSVAPVLSSCGETPHPGQAMTNTSKRQKIFAHPPKLVQDSSDQPESSLFAQTGGMRCFASDVSQCERPDLLPKAHHHSTGEAKSPVDTSLLLTTPPEQAFGTQSDPAPNRSLRLQNLPHSQEVGMKRLSDSMSKWDSSVNHLWTLSFPIQPR